MRSSLSLVAAVVVAVAVTGSAEAAQLTTPSLFIVAPTTVDCMVTNVSTAARDVTIAIMRSLGTGTAAAVEAGNSGVVTVAAGGVLSHRESISTNSYVYCEIAVTGLKGTVRGSMCALLASAPGCSTTVVAE